MDERIITDLLTPEQTELVKRLREVSEGKYGLPISVKDKIIGFGSFVDFYMFWITERAGSVYFNARLNFTKTRLRNVVRMELLPENEPRMLIAIEEIYQSYLKYKEAPDRYLPDPYPRTVTSQELQSLEEALSRLGSHISENGDSPLDKTVIGQRLYRILVNIGIRRDSELVECGAERLSLFEGVGEKAIAALCRYANRRASFTKSAGSAPDAPPKSDSTLQQHLNRWQKIRSELVERILAASHTPAPQSSWAKGEELRERLGALFDRLLDTVTLYSSHLSRPIDVLRIYTYSDSLTYEDIATEYGVTRERIRQLHLKGKRRIFSIYNRRSRTDAALIELTDEIYELLLSAEGSHIIPVLLGPPEFSKRKRCLFIELLLDVSLTKRSELTEWDISYKKEMRRATRAADIWRDLQAKIIYPAPKDLPPPTPPSEGRSPEITAAYIEAFKRKLSSLTEYLDFIECPDIVYYESTKTEHRPNFLLKTKDGGYVLAMLVSVGNMALYYNVSRFNELHSYCKRMGYGYLILDERGHSIFDYKNKKLNPLLISELERILDEKDVIIWNDVKDLRKRFEVNAKTLCAYVLQNKLHFSVEPYRIRRRRV